jgi:hypothetical protein
MPLRSSRRSKRKTMTAEAITASAPAADDSARDGSIARGRAMMQTASAIATWAVSCATSSSLRAVMIGNTSAADDEAISTP